MNSFIQIFIMTRNRPDTIIRAVESVLNQTYKNIVTIVSDNSTDNITELLLEPYVNSGKILYKRRKPDFKSGVDHINKIHSEATSEYYMIFHDDDEMLPDMVETLSQTTILFPDALAIGSNAYIIKNSKNKGAYFKTRNNIIIDSPDALIQRYVLRKAAPLPSYLYKNENKTYLEACYGGKYSDVSCLVTIAKKGIVIHCAKPLMKYYIHPGQDSGKHDFLQYQLLINYLKRMCHNYVTLRKLRVRYIYYNMRESSRFPYSKKSYLLLMKYSFFDCFIKYNIASCLKKKNYD